MTPATGQRRLADEIESVADKIYSQNAIRSRELSAIAAEVAKLEMAARSETERMDDRKFVVCNTHGFAGLEFCPQCRSETTQPFGWWDSFNEIMYFSHREAIMAAGGDNKITTLYAAPQGQGGPGSRLQASPNPAVAAPSAVSARTTQYRSIGMVYVVDGVIAASLEPNVTLPAKECIIYVVEGNRV